MFLYNLKDALEQLPADAGVQIHRSHWVSREHVKDLTKKNGSWECTLSNGKRLPISRRKYSEIKDLLGS
jgi:DNA-binding LytR/AlgR family response regulator